METAAPVSSCPTAVVQLPLPGRDRDQVHRLHCPVLFAAVEGGECVSARGAPVEAGSQLFAPACPSSRLLKWGEE